MEIDCRAYTRHQGLDGLQGWRCKNVELLNAPEGSCDVSISRPNKLLLNNGAVYLSRELIKMQNRFDVNADAVLMEHLTLEIALHERRGHFLKRLVRYMVWPLGPGIWMQEHQE